MSRNRQQISFLVPFKADAHGRSRVWRWLRRYWEHELPGAEIVMGRDDRGQRPFSKTCAVNNAARRAHGDIFVILDADAYIPGEVVQRCADRIREARGDDHPLWFVPYRKIFRLTQEATARVLRSDPCEPLRFASPPDPGDVESTEGSAHGHHFGAMIQIMPREAFETVGGMSPRFRGWGGEDIAFVRALDTLYGKHKSMHADVLHLWHPIHNEHKVQSWTVREWAGQSRSRMNDLHAMRYDRATGDRAVMRRLVDHDFAVYEQLKVVQRSSRSVGLLLALLLIVLAIAVIVLV
jgi:N-terminal domain of galactosyltransferase